MDGFERLHQARSDDFLRRLSGCLDVKACVDCAVEWLDALGRAYVEQPDAAHKQRVHGLLMIAKASLESMYAASRADWRLLPAPRQSGRRKEAVMYAPCALAAACAAWALIINQPYLSLVAVLAAAGAFFLAHTRLHTADAPRVEAAPRVDAQELERRVGYLTRLIDAQIAPDAQQSLPAPRLTLPMLESVQMLLEAQLTHDPDFALKGVTQLADALSRQGVGFVVYTKDSASDFDLVPAPNGGETIRPALKQEGRLLSKGLATVKMS